MSPEYLNCRSEKQKTVRRFQKCLAIEKCASILFFTLAVITFSRFEDSIPVALFAIIIVGFFCSRMVTQAIKENLQSHQRSMATVFQGEVWNAYQDWRSEDPATRDGAKGRRLLKKLIRATQREHRLREMEGSDLVPTLRRQLATL